MRALAATFVVLLLSLAGAPAGADQQDPRLERLFEALQAVADDDAARAVEAEIWTIWSSHPDAAVQELMDQGVAAMARRDNRAALAAFDRIVALAPDFAEGWNKRATVEYLLGDYDGSLSDIARTLDLEPRHFGALSGRGLVYAALARPELALDAFEAALLVNPHLTGARLNADAIRRELRNREI